MTGELNQVIRDLQRKLNSSQLIDVYIKARDETGNKNPSKNDIFYITRRMYEIGEEKIEKLRNDAKKINEEFGIT